MSPLQGYRLHPRDTTTGTDKLCQGVFCKYKIYFQFVVSNSFDRAKEKVIIVIK